MPSHLSSPAGIKTSQCFMANYSSEQFIEICVHHVFARIFFWCECLVSSNFFGSLGVCMLRECCRNEWKQWGWILQVRFSSGVKSNHKQQQYQQKKRRQHHTNQRITSKKICERQESIRQMHAFICRLRFAICWHLSRVGAWPRKFFTRVTRFFCVVSSVFSTEFSYILANSSARHNEHQLDSLRSICLMYLCCLYLPPALFIGKRIISS